MAQSPLWSIRRQLPNRYAAVQPVVAEVVQQLEQRAWPQRDVFSVHLALEEAITNAIEHGNQRCKDKTVTVVARLFGDHLHLEVCDCGEGFNPSEVPDPTVPDHLESIRGRGLFLMRHFMNAVEYRDGGRCVIMHKQRSDVCCSS